MSRRQTVSSIWGGGSPTFLHPNEIRRLGEIIRKHFKLPRDVEAGVEIDPRRLSRDHIAALREIGFNRASLGVQDFGQSGDVGDLYRHFGIDTETIVSAAIDLLY